MVFYTKDGRWEPAKNISDKINHGKGFEKHMQKKAKYTAL